MAFECAGTMGGTVAVAKLTVHKACSSSIAAIEKCPTNPTIRPRSRAAYVRRTIFHHPTPTNGPVSTPRSGQLDRDVATPLPPRLQRTRPARLARYSAIIGTRLASYPEVSAVRLFEECRAAGYAGGLSQLQIHTRQSFAPHLIPGP